MYSVDLDRVPEQEYLFQVLAHMAEHVKDNNTASSLHWSTCFLSDFLKRNSVASFNLGDPWMRLHEAIASASYGYVAKRNLAAIDGRRYMGQMIDAALRASKMFDELGEVYRG
jgi:hypothetical protein